MKYPIILLLCILPSVVVSEFRSHKVVQMIGKSSSTSNISQECTGALQLYIQNLEGPSTGNDWALKMLDSTSKIPVGLLSYNFGEMGHFEQCLSIQSNDDSIEGKYCLGRISVRNDTNNSRTIDANVIDKQIAWRHFLDAITVGIRAIGNPTWAICLPNNCSDIDVLEILTASHSVGLNFDSVTCQTRKYAYPELDTPAIIGIVLLAAVVFLMIMSTLYEIYGSKRKEKNNTSILAIFSVLSNGKKLFTVNKYSRELTCLHGIRVLSMLWIMTAHTFSIYTQGPVFNSIDFVETKDNPVSMILVSATLACDTFLLIGGCLVVYVFFRRSGLDGKFKINLIQYYLHRYLRVTPTMAGAVLVSATLLKYMGSGPNYQVYISEVFGGNCKTYWWSALLYVQNYVNVDKMCVGNSWYLDIDFQLFLISPLFLFLLSKYPKSGLVLITVATTTSMALSFYISYSQELSGITTSQNQKTSSQTFMNEYYLKTHTRASPWLIGLILGYILVKEKRIIFTAPRINKNVIILLWIICLVILGVCLFGGHSTLRGEEYDRLGNAFYIALVRPTWSLCIAWIIWACVMNYGGPIDKLLSQPIFQVFNKFTYSMYILHVTVLYMIVFGAKIPIYVTIYDLFFNFLGLFTSIFVIAVVWVLAFESPMIALEKIMFHKNSSK